MSSSFMFVGGSLDGRKVEVPYGARDFRVPLPRVPAILPPLDDDFNINFDVETYILDPELGKFVEKSMASSTAIKWETFHIKQMIGELMLVSGPPGFIEMGVEHLRSQFNKKMQSQIIEISQKFGLKLDAVKYFFEENKELKARNEELKKDNSRLNLKIIDLYGTIMEMTVNN